MRPNCDWQLCQIHAFRVYTLRAIGLILFGSRFEVQSLADKEDAFDAVVTSTHYAAFDNADSRVKWLPDRLAICATGGSVSKRQLYTTNTLVNYPIDCFVEIASRTPYFNRDDVTERLLLLRDRWTPLSRPITTVS